MAKNRAPNPPENVGEDVESAPSSGPSSGSGDSASEKFLAGYPGAALLIGDDGSVVCSNAKGGGLEALIEHEAAPEIQKLIETARTSGSTIAESVYLNSAKGEIVLEITVVPGARGNARTDRKCW